MTMPSYSKVNDQKLCFFDLAREIRDTIYTQYSSFGDITIHLLSPPAPVDVGLNFSPNEMMAMSLTAGSDDLLHRLRNNPALKIDQTWRASATQHSHLTNAESKALLLQKTSSGIDLGLTGVARSIHQEAKDHIFQKNVFRVLGTGTFITNYHDILDVILSRMLAKMHTIECYGRIRNFRRPNVLRSNNVASTCQLWSEPAVYQAWLALRG